MPTVIAPTVPSRGYLAAITHLSTASFPIRSWIVCPRITPSRVEISLRLWGEELIDEIKLAAVRVWKEGELYRSFLRVGRSDVNNGTARFEGKWRWKEEGGERKKWKWNSASNGKSNENRGVLVRGATN